MHLFLFSSDAPVFNVNFESENVAVGVGGTISFRCFALGNPAPTVMFTTPSPDPHGATIDSDGFITITDAADVPGPVTYMCVATNGISPADTLSYALYTGRGKYCQGVACTQLYCRLYFKQPMSLHGVTAYNLAF